MITIFNNVFIRVALSALLLILAASAGSTPASAQVSGQQVRRVLSQRFHSSDHVSFVQVAPPADARAAIERRSGVRLTKAQYTVFVATTGAHVDGYAVFDQERGQHELIDFAVFFDAHAVVTGVEVLAYREPYGEAIRGERFRQQFVGLSGSSGFRAERDIDVVSGATISSRAMCVGVKRASVVVDTMLASQQEAHSAR